MPIYDYMIQLDGFMDGSTNGEQQGGIEVLSFSWGMSDSSTLTSGEAAFTFHDLLISSYTSPASPRLMLACANGKRLKRAVLTARKPGAQADSLSVTLEDALITSYQSSGPEASDRLVDEFRLAFSSVDMKYRPDKADGSLDAPVQAGWDLSESKV